MKLLDIKIYTCDKLVPKLPSESVKCSYSDLISFFFFFRLHEKLLQRCNFSLCCFFIIIVYVQMFNN